jgi:preprotein translocase subunit SecG
MKNIFLIISFLFSAIFLYSQEVEKTDYLANTGKIYVVVAVLSIVFLGIVIFLIFLDRKIHKIEIQNKNE